MNYVARNHPQQVRERGADDAVDDRAAPWELFDPLHARFDFTIDAAASEANARLPRFWTREDDALRQSWADERVWCNPPYSDIRPWVEKAWLEVDALVVMLLPANRTEQGWWQESIEPHRDRGGRLTVEFLPDRIRFVRVGKDQQAAVHGLFGERASAAIGPNERPPFGSCLLIWSDTAKAGGT